MTSRESDRSPIQLYLGTPISTASFHDYRLAGHTLSADQALRELASFETMRSLDLSPPSADDPAMRPSDAQLLYEGLGWIGNAWREVECFGAEAGYWLSVREAGRFWVAPDGGSIWQLEPSADSDATVVVQAVLGPALILAMALRGTWCLHASAVARDDQVIAIIGESGSGKSTLAAFLAGERAGGWRLVADDILPFEPRQMAADALPHFPQLKLPADQQPAKSLAERLPLVGVYSLDESASGQAGVSVEPMTSRDAAIALVRHTVAARLFDGELLARHLACCADAATMLRVGRLSYPRRLSALPRVAATLEADLKTRARAAFRIWPQPAGRSSS